MVLLDGKKISNEIKKEIKVSVDKLIFNKKIAVSLENSIFFQENKGLMSYILLDIIFCLGSFLRLKNL